MSTQHVAMPEWLGRDDLDARPWEVEAGEPEDIDVLLIFIMHELLIEEVQRALQHTR